MPDTIRSTERERETAGCAVQEISRRGRELETKRGRETEGDQNESNSR